MTTLEIKSDWSLTKDKLKRKWAVLTDDDFQSIDAQLDKLLARIERQTGAPRAVAENTIKECTSTFDWARSEPFLSQTMMALVHPEPSLPPAARAA